MALWKNSNKSPKNKSQILIEHESFFGSDDTLKTEDAYYYDGKFNISSNYDLSWDQYAWKITRWCYINDVLTIEDEPDKDWMDKFLKFTNLVINNAREIELTPPLNNVIGLANVKLLVGLLINTRVNWRFINLDEFISEQELSKSKITKREIEILEERIEEENDIFIKLY